ncbi:PID-CTERM protein-sorting domain-containing protein [Persicobacter diffluens]|uniref:Uncharacterized protein n=1 Tax=Persicobacter diffluens TaxID=981 RepID=A0AAN4VZ59_9BACT|nr:hypothetical protein PEDI_33110 [Persicobacter diffluens]
MDHFIENNWFIIQPAARRQEGLQMRPTQSGRSSGALTMTNSDLAPLPPFPDGTNAVPIDGGTGILLAAGAVLGFKKLKGKMIAPFK